MADHSVAADENGVVFTLTAATADTVTFAKDLARVEIVSDGADEVYVTIDKAAPTVGDKKAFYLPAAPCSRVITADQRGATVVRVISAGTPKLSVARPDS